jgi:ATP-dependent DNA helicase RecQ
LPDLEAEVQRLFGWKGFRPGQEAVARHALEGRDCLAVMPTGSGKSLCYQLAAMLRPTPTLVVSPLIALMKDQVEHLPPALRERATFINSTLDAAQAGERLQAVADGRVSLLYAAPERLRQSRFAEALRAARIGLVVVDEAHCVALWGHDFRPDYLFIRSVLDGPLRSAAVLALTATATPDTADEIRRALGRTLEVVRFSVVRENLRYEVVELGDEEEKLRFTLERAAVEPGAGIVYARARERCERIAALLRRARIPAAHYHAGLEREERARTQEAFLEGGVRVVVATTAFGMGVDKPDIRWVLLYNYPTSLEEYVQQVGRAGRDGGASTCLLLATARDAQNLRAFARRDTPTLPELRSVWLALRQAGRAEGGPAVLTADALASAADLPEGKDPRVHCGVLERAGLVQRHFDGGPAMHVSLLPPPSDAAARIDAVLQRLRAESAERVRRMVDFAESRRCRHAQVAAHFGDAVAEPCGRCDVCAPGPREARPARPGPADPPADPARAILDAVAGLRWPLGVSGLVSLLRGSVQTPPSARNSAGFGVLGAVPTGTVRRWVEQLVAGGHLVQIESAGGFPVLEAGRRDGLPALGRGRRGGEAARGPAEEDAPLGPAERELFSALRAWRAREAKLAGVPPYVVAPDRTLRAVARHRPRTPETLAAIGGLGPKRLEAWGESLLALVAGAAD